MTGAVVIWYVAGAIIALMVGLEVRARRADGQKGPLSPLVWMALAAAALIFGLWPWVALNLAQNISL